MEQTVKQWVEHAESDLKTARALVKSRRNVHALFFCQQAVEKTLKAVFVFKKRKHPPRIHNLTRLAELAELSLDPNRTRTLARISSFYIQSRYPDEISKIVTTATAEEPRRGLKETEEIVQWLLSILS